MASAYVHTAAMHRMRLRITKRVRIHERIQKRLHEPAHRRHGHTSRPLPPRPGTTLVELVVALSLLLLIIAIGGTTARRTLDTQSRLATLDARATTISDALRTLSRHAATIEPSLGDLHSTRDTMIDFTHAFGDATICRVASDSVVIITSADSTPWSTALPRAVTSEDDARIWHDARQRWETRAVRTAGAATGTCGDSTAPWPGTALQRLVLADTLPGLRPGAPMRTLQRERWSLVRGGDGAWALSLATWNRGTRAFNTPQPLAAPLAAPSAPTGAGLVIRAIDATGTPLPDSALRNTRTLDITIRASPHVRYGTPSDSVRINVAHH
jgi:type II secretory pathway pseudopilin PulG